MRDFESGATRDDDTDKLDFEGFLSPIVLRRFAEYMHKHRVQADGKLRDSDNWQKGLPLDQYFKSLWRHFFDAWEEHRSDSATAHISDHMIESLCAVVFNVQGYLHEALKLRAAVGAKGIQRLIDASDGQVINVDDLDKIGGLG